MQSNLCLATCSHPHHTWYLLWQGILGIIFWYALSFLVLFSCAILVFSIHCILEGHLVLWTMIKNLLSSGSEKLLNGVEERRVRGNEKRNHSRMGVKPGSDCTGNGGMPHCCMWSHISMRVSSSKILSVSLTISLHLLHVNPSSPTEIDKLYMWQAVQTTIIHNQTPVMIFVLYKSSPYT